MTKVFYDPYGTWPEMRGGLGAWVATPGYIWEQIAALDAEYETVGRELRDQIEECLPDKPNKGEAYCIARRNFTANVWTPLKSSWDAFVANHDAWYNRLWGSTVDVINDYRQKLIKVRAAAKQATFYFQSPEPPAPPEGTLSSVGRTLKFVAVSGVVIAGLAIVYKLLPTKMKTSV